MEGRLGKSDHEIIAFKIEDEIKRKNEGGSLRDFRRGDYKEMREDMMIDWEELM